MGVSVDSTFKNVHNKQLKMTEMWNLSEMIYKQATITETEMESVYKTLLLKPITLSPSP